MSAYLPLTPPLPGPRQAPPPSAEKTLPRARGPVAPSGDGASDRASDFERLLSSPPLNFDTPGSTSADADIPSAGLTRDASSEYVTTSLTAALHAELTARNDLAAYSPFSFSLQLPQLGDVDVRMSALHPVGWEVMLRFQRAAYSTVRHQRERCRRALSAAFDCPIRLAFEVQEAQ